MSYPPFHPPTHILPVPIDKGQVHVVLFMRSERLSETLKLNVLLRVKDERKEPRGI
jgi:hypothetical protein